MQTEARFQTEIPFGKSAQPLLKPHHHHKPMSKHLKDLPDLGKGIAQFILVWIVLIGGWVVVGRLIIPHLIK